MLCIILLRSTDMRVLIDAHTSLPLLLPVAIGVIDRASAVLCAEAWIVRCIGQRLRCFLAAELTVARCRVVACVVGTVPLCLADVLVDDLLLEDSRCIPVKLADHAECDVLPACATLRWATTGTLRRNGAGLVCAAACAKAVSFAGPIFAPRVSTTEIFGDAAWEGVGTAAPRPLLFELAPAVLSPDARLSAVVAMRDQSDAPRQTLGKCAAADGDDYVLSLLDRVAEPGNVPAPEPLPGGAEHDVAKRAFDLPFSCRYEPVSPRRIMMPPQRAPPLGFAQRSLCDLFPSWTFEAIEE